jgi:sigma-B regulation protein RsbQ
LVLGHGVGGRPIDWQPLVEALRDRFRVITFAQAGSLDADPDLFEPTRHCSLLGFADDLGALCAELGLRNLCFVGHSLAACAGALAAIGDPDLIARMVMLNGSACYISDAEQGYIGGFTSEQVDQILSQMRTDYAAWAAGFGQLIIGEGRSPHESREFVRVLRRLNPQVTATCLEATFRGDFRALMGRLAVPTLVLQSVNDPAVPIEAAEWLAETIPDARLQLLPSPGHFPHVVDPQMVLAAIEPFLDEALI